MVFQLQIYCDQSKKIKDTFAIPNGQKSQNYFFKPMFLPKNKGMNTLTCFCSFLEEIEDTKKTF